MGNTLLALPALIWLIALTQIPALRALTRYAPLPEFAIPALVLSVAAVLVLLCNPPRWLKKSINTPWPSALVVMLLSIGIALVYPLADGLKTHLGGSDADDAIQLGSVALWHFTNPYALTTYFGNPFSPGPGWLALNGPLAVLELQPLGVVCALIFALWAMHQVKLNWPTINMFTLVWANSLGVWELVSVGNDLPAFGLVLLGAMVLLTQPRLSKTGMLTLAIVIGCLATTRISFFYLPLLVGFALFAVWPTRALWVAGVGIITATLWHGIFWALQTGFYPPLHLVARGESLMGGSTLLGAIGILGVTGTAMLYHWRWWNPYVQVALGLGAPLSVLATAELVQAGSFAKWEGATFLLAVLPIMIMAVLTTWPLTRALAIRENVLPKKSSISVTKNQTTAKKPLAKRARSR